MTSSPYEGGETDVTTLESDKQMIMMMMMMMMNMMMMMVVVVVVVMIMVVVTTTTTTTMMLMVMAAVLVNCTEPYHNSKNRCGTMTSILKNRHGRMTLTL